MNNFREQYRNLKNFHRGLSLFYQPWWLDAAAKDWDIVLLEKEQKIQALLPYQKEHKFGLKLFRKPLVCPYLGPLVFQKGNKKIYEELFELLPTHDYYDFATQPGEASHEYFDQKDWEKQKLITYILDLSQPEEDMFSGIQSRLRSYIRKAEKLLTVKEGAPKDMQLFCDWHKIPFDKKKTKYPYTPQQFQTLIEAAEQNNSSLFQTALDVEDRPVAMLWTPFDTKSGYHLLSATSPDTEVNGATALLVWNAIKKLKSKGITFYDFEGSMDKGIAQFFKKFGGKESFYFYFQNNNSTLWRLKRKLLG